MSVYDDESMHALKVREFWKKAYEDKDTNNSNTMATTAKTRTYSNNPSIADPI